MVLPLVVHKVIAAVFLYDCVRWSEIPPYYGINMVLILIWLWYYGINEFFCKGGYYMFSDRINTGGIGMVNTNERVWYGYPYLLASWITVGARTVIRKFKRFSGYGFETETPNTLSTTTTTTTGKGRGISSRPPQKWSPTRGAERKGEHPCRQQRPANLAAFQA